jgi:hypothetical protein
MSFDLLTFFFIRPFKKFEIQSSVLFAQELKESIIRVSLTLQFGLAGFQQRVPTFDFRALLAMWSYLQFLER